MVWTFRHIKLTSGELIAILECDHDYLRNMAKSPPSDIYIYDNDVTYNIRITAPKGPGRWRRTTWWVKDKVADFTHWMKSDVTPMPRWFVLLGQLLASAILFSIWSAM